MPRRASSMCDCSHVLASHTYGNVTGACRHTLKCGCVRFQPASSVRDAHRFPPVSLRLPEGDRDWWLAEAQLAGYPTQTLSQEQSALRKLFLAALAEYRKTHTREDAQS